MVMEWIKKVLGGGTPAVTSKVDSATQTASGAAAQAQASAQNAARSAAATVQGAKDTATANVSAATAGAAGGLAGLFGGGIPNAEEVQKAVDSLSQDDLQKAVTPALESVPAETRGQFGAMLHEMAQGKGMATPAGAATGEPADLGSLLSSVLKGEGGLGQLGSLFGGGAGGGLDLGTIMKNPMAQAVLAAVLPAILKAVKGNQ